MNSLKFRINVIIPGTLGMYSSLQVPKVRSRSEFRHFTGDFEYRLLHDFRQVYICAFSVKFGKKTVRFPSIAVKRVDNLQMTFVNDPNNV